MKISDPPYTNRGVTRQKEDLTALIDWCQITVKGADVFTIIEDILRIPLSFMELHGKEKGIAGHELIARFDNIKILKPTGNAQYEGFQILMSGSGCRNYENFLLLNRETWFDFLERVCRYPVNFPRIDLAIDDRKPYLKHRGKRSISAVNTVIFELYSMKRDMNRQKSSEKNSTRTGTDMNSDSGTKKRAD